eukprot:scaffold186070_cov31-Prasinocladus_malaysianus.AAC.1
MYLVWQAFDQTLDCPACPSMRHPIIANYCCDVSRENTASLSTLKRPFTAKNRPIPTARASS